MHSELMTDMAIRRSLGFISVFTGESEAASLTSEEMHRQDLVCLLY